MKRSTNHQNLLQVLKKVNLMIQNAAKLRVGQPKIDVVRECREAVKAGNVKKLFKLIGGGDLDMDRDVGIRENKKEKNSKDGDRPAGHEKLADPFEGTSQLSHREIHQHQLLRLRAVRCSGS
jgi:hypothetical protein